jgi:hypothetical protein
MHNSMLNCLLLAITISILSNCFADDMPSLHSAAHSNCGCIESLMWCHMRRMLADLMVGTKVIHGAIRCMGMAMRQHSNN